MNETKTLAAAGRAEYSRKTAEASGMDRVVSGRHFQTLSSSLHRPEVNICLLSINQPSNPTRSALEALNKARTSLRS